MPQYMETELHANALLNQNVHSHVGVRIQIQTFGADGTGQTVNVGNGRIQSMSADQDFGLQPVHGVGDYNPVEHAPTRFDGTITLDAFRIRKKDLVKLGLAALGSKILQFPIFRIQLFDKTKGTEPQGNFRTYVGCSIGRYSERFQEGAICGENATVKFIDVLEGQ